MSRPGASSSRAGCGVLSRRRWGISALACPLLLAGCMLLIGCMLLVGCISTSQRGTIGAILLRKADGRVFVEEAPAHLAAAQAGVRPGDELLLVDGQDVRRLNDEELSRVLGGGVGDPVSLTLTRRNRVIRVQVDRSPAERYRLE